MIVQEQILKEGKHLQNRCNALALGFEDFKLLDWNPMWVILVYDTERAPGWEGHQKKERKSQ